MDTLEKARADICMLASKQAFEDVWDGKDLSNEQVETKAEQVCEEAEDTKSVYAKAYAKTKDILQKKEQILTSMKFDYRMIGFATAYGHIKDDVEAVALSEER